jgi:hypothetical protein
MLEHRLKMLESTVMKNISAPKGEEVTGDLKRLHVELHNLYTSSNIIWIIKSRRIRRVDHAASMKTKRNANNILIGNSEGMRQLWRPSKRQYQNEFSDKYGVTMWTAYI